MVTSCCTCDKARSVGGTSKVRGWSTRTVLAAVALWALGVDAAYGQTLVVTAGPVSCVSHTKSKNIYATIQSAVSAAGAGTTVLVCPGSYPEMVTITTPLTLRGVVDTVNNAGAAVISLPNGGTGTAANYGPGTTFGSAYAPALAQIVVSGAAVTIENIAVDGSNVYAGCASAPSVIGVVLTAGASATLNAVSLRNQNLSDGNAGYCASGATSPAPVGLGVLADETSVSLSVENSNIRNFDFLGVYSLASGAISVSNSVVTGVIPANGAVGLGMAVSGSAGTQLSGNRIDSCVGYGIAVFDATQPIVISGNTILSGGNGQSSSTLGLNYGIYASGNSDAVTISRNTIANAAVGVLFSGGGVAGTPATIEGNAITGELGGVVLLSAVQSASVLNNVINDAQVGIYGAAGNALSDNRFRSVSTLTQ